MNLNHDDYLAAAQSAGLSPEQTERFWAQLNLRSASPVQPRFDGVHVSYYLGALLVLGAMGWFVTNAWNRFSGGELALVALGYALVFLLAGKTCWDRPALRIPAGLLLTLAVGMVPLAVFGLEKATGLWPAEDPGEYTRFHPYIDGSWIGMELATILAGLLVLRRWRFPFLTAPIAYAAWYLSMDLPQFLLGHRPFSWDEKELITVLFGAVMLAVAYAADLRQKRDGDFAFWGYLFGVAAFWGGLTSMNSGEEFSKFVYAVINCGLIGVSLLLRRRVFIVFGSLGLFGYLGHLAYRVFRDSAAFPVILSLAGLGLIALGVLYQRHHVRIEEWLRRRVGTGFGRWLPEHARDA